MEDRFGFDPQLPALPLAFDLAAIARLFQEQWPAPPRTVHPPIIVQDCRLQDTKYQPMVRCVTTYELRVARPGEAAWPTIGVLDISPAGPAHRLFIDDPLLPGLGAAIDPEQVGGRLAEVLARSRDAGMIERCTITPIRYKPGARCVVRYELGSTAGPQVFFGKLFAQDGDQVMAILGTLHEVGQITPGMPQILQPLAYWPDMQMLVQPAVSDGVELNTLAFDQTVNAAVREHWLHTAGAGLAALHQSTGTNAPRRTLQDDLAELAEYRAPMAQVQPALAERYTILSDEIAKRAAALAESAPVASHGAFRPDQFMIERDHLVMIDLDSFCWAAPARDIGNFLAYLRWKAIRRPAQAEFLERTGEVLRAGYRTLAPAPDAESLRLYQAASLLKIAGRRFRSLSVKEWPLVPHLLTAAQALLDAG